MQASVFLPEMQYFKESVFLNIYNGAWKPGFLKSSHIISYETLNLPFEPLKGHLNLVDLGTLIAF